jgi:Leucine-rich repeat (LRR) protein
MPRRKGNYSAKAQVEETLNTPINTSESTSGVSGKYIRSIGNLFNENSLKRIENSSGKPAAGFMKSVGYLKDDSWDRFTVARFVDAVSKSVGASFDVEEIMKRFDINGDGFLNRDEQTAMIEGLATGEYEKTAFSKSIAQSIVEQLKDLYVQNGQNERSRELKTIRKYENLFWYENDLSEIPLFGA